MTVFVVFGGTGDLNRRKLLPALHHLARRRLLGERHAILGVARDPARDDASLRRWAREALDEAGLPQEEAAAWCDERVFYHCVGSGTREEFRGLACRIERLEAELGLPGNRVFYLALPPGGFPDTITGLGEAGLNRSAGWTRLVVEKPFGRHLTSARELNALAHRYFDESQLYRIDHYLGKATVQNLLVFRFANAIFESLWNRDRIESVQFTVAESLGVEGRDVPSYREEPGVAPNSRTESYVALRLRVDTWRWQGVPFYVRTGKRLPRRLTQIAVTFRRPPVCLFETLGGCEPNANVLLLTLQPNEGFVLCFDVKEPTEPLSLRTLPLHFDYKEAFGEIPDAYETLLSDVLTGDQTLFVHAEETEASWRLYTPLLGRDLTLHAYPSGTWGPEAATHLLGQGGHRWEGPIDTAK